MQLFIFEQTNSKLIVFLRDIRTSMIYYAENRKKMCPMCQFLTEGIETEDDRGKFEKKLNRKIEELQELRDEEISGEI